MAAAPSESQSSYLRFSLLGPLSLEVAGVAVSLGPLKQRLLLAALLCRANAPVSVDMLTAVLWDGEPPRTFRKNIQVYVVALRRILDRAGAGGRLTRQAGGYLLAVTEDELDTLRFQRLARAGQDGLSSGALAGAVRSLREALDLWRGWPLQELRSSQFISDEIDRIGMRYLHVYEDWAEAELRIGNAGPVANTIYDLVERYPDRERLRGAQMRALHSLGRQTEALAVYEELRRLLATQLGVNPTPPLEALYRSMLAGAEYGPRWTPASGLSGTGGYPLLPPDLGDFTGRAGQVTELAAMLDRGFRVAVITGTVGMGKTAFAVHAAHRLAGRYPDGRLLIRMRDAHRAPRGLTDVLAELARLTGIVGLLADHPERAAAIWRFWLAHQKLLLVLDDAADEANVRPLVPDTGQSAIVVTTSTRLAGLEWAGRLEMPPFTLAEALELLSRIAGSGRFERDPKAAASIVIATGMVPLAVRASGLKLALLRHLPAAEYASRLADDAAVLDELTVGDVNVRESLAAGWRDLSSGTRDMLIHLATLPAGLFTLADAAAAFKCRRDSARKRLEFLIHAGVVNPPEYEVTAYAAVYELPRLIHIYAREHSGAGEEARTGRRAAAGM